MPKIVVITGAGAGVGERQQPNSRGMAAMWRCCHEIRSVWNTPHPNYAASASARCRSLPTLPMPKPLRTAADKVEAELGPIDVWVNVAMATVFAPVHKLTAEEFQRGTAVTYLGQVHGTMAALKHMRPRNRGSIVSVGSALAYRSVPLQSIYCGAKFAIRGFLDSLRSELLHDKINITLTAVDLPAVNTPQFDWARNKMGHKAQPVPPIYQPEVPARAIYFGAFNPRRQIWVGFPTVKAILANRIAPGLIDRYLAKFGYASQLSQQPSDPEAPGNLFEPVSGAYGAHGRFDDQAKSGSWEMFTSRHRDVFWAASFVGLIAGVHLLANASRSKPSARLLNLASTSNTSLL